MAGAQGGSTSTGKGGKGAYISAIITDSTYFYKMSVTVGGTDGKTGGGMPTSSAYCRLGGVGGGYSSISYYIGNKYTTVLVAGGGGGAGFDPYCGTTCNSSAINGGSGGLKGLPGQGSPAMKTSYGGAGGKNYSDVYFPNGGFYNSSYGIGGGGQSFRGGSPASDTCGGGGGGKSCYEDLLGGKGGTTSGGAGGFYNSTYKYGSQGYSYHGGSPASDTCGGGGGAGYYGGGGGSFTGGGGGSSYYYPSAVTNLIQAPGANTGGGYITFTYWSALNLQPTLRPTLRPTAYPTSALSDDSSTSTNALSIVIPILIIAVVAECCYYYGKNKDNFTNNTSTAVTYTPNPARPVTLPRAKATTTAIPPATPRFTARPTTTATATRVGPKKIDSAVTIMNKFLSSMMGARDRCSIVSFSDEYNIRQNLSSSAPCIASLDACRYSTGGGTALYDAAVASVVQFAATADRTRPWLLIILTDGEDTNSRTKPSELIEVLKLFNQASSNFVFVVGLGASLQDTELRRICEQSKSLYLRANDIETMQLMFALIALVVIEQNQVQIARVQAEGVDAIFARARTARAVATIPIDMIILLDTSGSMNEST
eukprot:CAMPEP_0173142440 /NCGR_PEP_ID=MMETSP1105-20130129/6086_1 /TAXON_ID=2985 /ORGANISM="Ochromonas sp., Strain BG-1" /LENGTH=595 /DNA_ID=CAMNT_0014055825 /DNA_START=113 /DNA_END=1902 /DNA_ORIENTATION=+